MKKVTWYDRITPLPQHPARGTLAAKNYIESYSRVNFFFDWLSHMADSIDGVAEILDKAVLIGEDDEAKRLRIEEEAKLRLKMTDIFRSNEQMLLEIILGRHVDNYLNYFAELLTNVFVARPETLRSSEKIDMEDVLRHSSMEEFVRFAAERKVEQLAYLAYSDLLDYFRKRFRIILARSGDVSIIVEAIEIRNISTHNRCIINARYCRRTGTDESQIGKMKVLRQETIQTIAKALFRSVCLADTASLRALKLGSVPLSFKYQAKRRQNPAKTQSNVGK